MNLSLFSKSKFVIQLFAISTLTVCYLNAAPTPKTSEKAAKPILTSAKKAKLEKASSKKEKVLYALDFTKGATAKVNARKWLSDKGFEFKSDATSQRKLAVSFNNEALVLQAKEKLFGLIMMKKRIDNAKKIRIIWGVNKFPKGASYDKKVNNEAVMVYVYFGDKKLSSGGWFGLPPAAPYFIGLYLGETDKIGTSHIGRHYAEGGRFICIANPKPGETVTSEFDLNKGFKDCFKKKAVPFISAIALEVETSGSGPSKAFIKKIEILD